METSVYQQADDFITIGLKDFNLKRVNFLQDRVWEKYNEFMARAHSTVRVMFETFSGNPSVKVGYQLESSSALIAEQETRINEGFCVHNGGDPIVAVEFFQNSALDHDPAVTSLTAKEFMDIYDGFAYSQHGKMYKKPDGAADFVFQTMGHRFRPMIYSLVSMPDFFGNIEIRPYAGTDIDSDYSYYELSLKLYRKNPKSDHCDTIIISFRSPDQEMRPLVPLTNSDWAALKSKPEAA